MEKIQKEIEAKNRLLAERMPKYGMRKFSVGLVSCILGYALWAAPAPVLAQEAQALPEAVAVESPSADEPASPVPSTSENISSEVSDQGAAATGSDTGEASKKVDTTSPMEATETSAASLSAAENQGGDESLLKEEPAGEKPLEAQPAKPVTKAVTPAPVADNQLETPAGTDAPAEEKESPASVENQAEPATAANPLEAGPEEAPSPVSAGAGTGPASVGVAKNPTTGEAITKTDGSMAADEAKVGNYKDSEIANNGVKHDILKDDVGTQVEGVTATTSEPNAETIDKRTVSVTIDVDKDASQRTYTEIGSSSTQRGAPLTPNDNGKVETKIDGVNQPNPTDDVNATVETGRQAKYFVDAEKTYLEKLNHKDNKTGQIKWSGQYTTDNPNNQITSSENFEAHFSVNPFPNENRNLSIISVTGETSVNTVPVKGQYIKTGARIDNLLRETFTITDEQGNEKQITIDDYSRISSEVYHPDGYVVDSKYAQAILITPDNKADILAEMQKQDPTATLTEGDVVFKMPQGAIMNDPEAAAKGEYKPILNPNSIFNDPVFKNIQNLSARFFARPRTEAEFRQIVDKENADQGWVSKYYTDTGAGTTAITHNGEMVVIANQGIARYDHYNKVGEITINLDDTRFYDQNWDTKKVKDTDKMTGIKPGESKTMEIKAENEGKYPHEKTASEMNEARNKGLVTGKVDPEFIARAEADGWKIEITPGDLSSFKVTAPATAKAGDFIALPMSYTYTNGSEDAEWFHFVVQESDNNRPEYHAKAGYQGERLTNTPIIPDGEKDKEKKQPTSYELKQGVTYTDDKGNTWTDIKINGQTGEVTAVVPENVEIIGGENLYVPVIVNYTDATTGQTKTEEVKAQFIARPRYQAEVVHEYEKDIPFESKEIYDENLDMGVIQVVQEGTVGKKKVKFTQAVQNGVKGIIVNGVFEPGDAKFTVIEETLTEKQDRLVKVGVKPLTQEVNIKHDTEIIYDPTLAAGEEVVDIEGSDGVAIVKTVRDPQTGVISTTTETTTAPVNRKVRVGTKYEYTHEDHIPYDTTIQFDDQLAAGEKKTVTEGVVGVEKTVVKAPEIVSLDDMMAEIGEENFLLHDETNGVYNLPNYEAMANYMVGKGYWDVSKITKTTDQYGNVMAASYNGQTFEALMNGFDSKNSPTGTITIPERKVTTTTTEKVDKVIKVGTKTEGTLVDTDPIKHGFKVEYDSSIPKGQWAYKKNAAGEEMTGTDGSITKTWTIENSQKVGDPTETRVEPVDAVILVGSKDFTGSVSHDVTEKIPFNVQVIEDTDLAPGKVVVQQQGKEGTKTTTYTQNIKNGTAEGDIQTTVTNNVAAVDHIIRVGKKPVTNTKEANSEVGVEIKYEYDPSLDVGKAELGDYTPGKVVTTVTNTYNPTTGQIETSETAVVTKPIQVIKVGTNKFTGDLTNTVKETIPFEVIIQPDDTLAAGETRVETEGKNGEKTKTITQKFVNGVQESFTVTDETVTTEKVDKVIKVGTMTDGTHSHTEDIPFEYTVEYDPTMKAGTYKEVTKGEKGSKTTTWTIKNSKVVEGSAQTSTTKQPVSALIKVGSKDFTGTFTTTDKDVVPYDVEYKVDPSLAPGVEEVDQEGVLGEKETVTTHTIKNGTVESSVVGTTTQTKAPVKKIVRIGAKTDGSHEVVQEIPFDIEVKTDPSLNKGQWKYEKDAAGNEKRGVKGSKKTTLSIENSKVTNADKLAWETTKEAQNAVVIIGEGDLTGSYDIVSKNIIPFDVEYKLDETLSPGAEVVEQAGKNGESQVTTTLTIVNGKVTGKDVGETITNSQPTTKIVRIGAQKEGSYTHTEKIPFEVKVEVDESMNKGDYKIVTQGVEGSKTTKFTIKNAEVTGTSVTSETKPITQVVKVGSKDFTGQVQHTENVPIPFEVEIRYMAERPAGIIDIIQEGEVGEKEVTYTQKIKNGVKDGDMTTSSTETKAAVKRIVEIGTQTVTKEVDKPIETVFEYNDQLDSGIMVEKQAGKAGKTTVQVYYDQASSNLKTIERTEEGQKRIVEIGTKAVEKSVDIPFNTEYELDDTMEYGKTEEKTAGVKGTKTITSTFNPQTGKIEVTETDVAPTNRVVKVGSKTTGQVKYVDKIAYEVEVIRDDTMAAGDIVTVQEGEEGLREVSINVVNSQRDGNIEARTIKDPVKKIVKVGTLCKMPPKPNPGGGGSTKPSNPPTPGTTDPSHPVRPNPSQPGGSSPDQPTKPNPGQSGGSTPDKPVPPSPDKPIKPNPGQPGGSTPDQPVPPSPETPVKPDPVGPSPVQPTPTQPAPVGPQAPGQPAAVSQANGDSLAPKTFDPGVLPYAGLAGAASALLALLGARRKEDEE
ncbi:G5 domain-containing protein [Peptococcus simiae]|uniref:G5 domain-containing protein n=1 Tax=Peptococcus simiae TaxID=1643805 RepID=UPI00397FC0E1